MKVGIDLGGSHIAIGVVNDKGKLTGFVTRSSLITSLSQQFLTGGEK